ncbi:LysR family transcriptional regulator [Alteromonas sp. 1_MG-2023]|uniref:LysR family transcriptional regulator n=1 Tax=Alteromonas sp. 1_MG-2023 TaxID=3062669 RepID=UPI0026E463C6|nr:LysR family transcriptional regulator [Alteromonas sp. 1_MG-2023]MDO6475387.1 LysR family transcriptional regulator [Alteromonas sp. 1_MG-2023]
MRFLLSRHLAQFVAIYDKGSLRAASEVLNVSQPALSKSLSQFEMLLDVKLFDRTGGRLNPTPFADILRTKANIILKEAEITTREIEKIKQNYYKPLTGSAGPVWLSEILPDVLPLLYHQFPGLNIGIKLESADVAIPKVLNGDSDMYFGLIPAVELAHGLSAIPLLNLESMLFARRSHPIHALPANERAASLCDYPWSAFGIWEGAINISMKENLQRKGIPFSGFTYGIESLLGLARIGQQTDHIIMSVDAVSETFAQYDLIPVEAISLNQTFSSGMVCRTSLTDFEPVNYLLEALRTRYNQS